MREKIKQLIGLIVVINLVGFVIMVLVWRSGILDSEPLPQSGQVFWQSPSLSRIVTKTSPNVESVWMLPNIFIEKADRAIFLSVNDKSTFFLGNMEQKGAEHLFSLDTETGEVLWQVESDNYVPISFATTSNHIFIGYFTARISSYDVGSGNKIWQTRLSSSTGFLGRETAYGQPTTIQSMVPTSAHLYVSATGPGDNNTTRLLEISTGEVNQISNQLDIVSVGPSYFYSQRAPNIMRAIDIDTGNIVWETTFEGGAFKEPAIIDDLVFVKTGLYGQSGWIYAISKETGAVLWQTEKNVSSNVAASGKYIFYLTSDAQLQILNIETRELVGSVNFSPNSLEGVDTNLYDFYVVAKDNLILVYFGDSRQLFTFRFLLGG